jgi:Cof subfamily protein (haloacid dehalogenase superfamily)
VARFRLLAMDIDGTVTDSAHQVRPAVRAAIGAALDQGVAAVLATGRVLSTTRPVADAIDPRLGAITNNGAVIRTRIDQPPLRQSLLPAPVAREVIARLQALGLTPIVFAAPDDAEVVAAAATDRLPPRFAARFADSLRAVGELAAWVTEPVLLVTTLLGDTPAAEALVRAQTVLLGAALAGRAAVSPLWHPLYGSWILDFLAPGCSKWQALLTYGRVRGIAPAEMVAIGDGLNDIPMVSGAGLGVAMGQSGPELLAAADVVVADNDHDGVAEAIARFVLD